MQQLSSASRLLRDDLEEAVPTSGTQSAITKTLLPAPLHWFLQRQKHCGSPKSHRLFTHIQLHFMSSFAPLASIHCLPCHSALNSFCAGAAARAAHSAAADARAVVLVSSY